MNFDIVNLSPDDNDYPDEPLAAIVFGGDVIAIDMDNITRAIALVAEHNMAHASIRYMAYSSRGYKVILQGGGVLNYERRNKAYWQELAALAAAMGPGRDVRLSNVRTYGKVD